MNPKTDRREQLWLCFFALLALVAPALVGYDVCFQWNTPALDLGFDKRTGLVYEVPQGTPADWAGLLAGDVILSVDGIPLSEWDAPAVGNYAVQIERDGQRLTLELPLLPLARVNLLSLVSAAAVALIFWGIGTLLLLRRFRQKEVRLLFLLAQAFAILLLFPLAHPPPSVLPIWAIQLSSACFYLAAPLLLHYYLTFPVPLGTPRQRRRSLVVIYGLALISVAFWRSGAPLARWGAIYAILEVAAAVVVLVYVYLRRATPDGRRRLRLVVFGNIMAASASIFFYILPFMTGASYGIPEWLTALFLVTVPLSYLYATARHNLFGIDRLLNRALVYALLALGILILYLGPFLLIYRFLPGDPLAQIMVVAGLTLLVGLAFDWSRTQVQRLVDRLFYGGWYDYPGVVETVSAALARTLEREQLADVLTRQAPELMQLRPGHLWIGEQSQSPSPPHTHTPTLSFPLTFQGQVRGLWSVEPRRDEEDLAASDRRILETLADQAEIALSNVLLVETLRRQLDQIRASRETLAQTQHQLLRSREEERARLARELHDGPIQSLVAMNLQLSLLLSQPSPPAPLPTLSEGSPPSLSQDWEREGKGKGEGDSSPVQALRAIRDEVRYLLADLRRACAELRPPILDALGLVPALRVLAEEWSLQSNVPVCLDLPSDEMSSPLPEEVEVNLYRVVQEALANVARHAAARQVTIQLVEEASRLTLTIQDDGRGFVVPADAHDLTAQDHFGLVSMQERVNLIGGTWTIESSPGQGTTVRVLWQTQD